MTADLHFGRSLEDPRVASGTPDIDEEDAGEYDCGEDCENCVGEITPVGRAVAIAWAGEEEGPCVESDRGGYGERTGGGDGGEDPRRFGSGIVHCQAACWDVKKDETGNRDQGRAEGGKGRSR